MKTIFLVLTLSFFAIHSSSAQERRGNRTRSVSTFAENFIGTWTYESGDYSIVITFRKGEVANFELLLGTYQVRMDGRNYDDLSGMGIMGIPNYVDRSERSLREGRFNPNEILFNLIDETHFHGLSQFRLTMEAGRTDRAVLKMVPHDERIVGLGENQNIPSNNLLPPDGTVLVRQ